MKGIPDEWCCDVKALMTELNSGPEVCSARDVGQWNADVLEIRWTKTVDTVKSSKCYLERYSLKHRKPVKDITKDRSDVVKLAGTNNQTGGGVQHHLQMAGDFVSMRRTEQRYNSQPESQRRLQPAYVA